ncbi:MAG: MFS transporter [Bacillota bacterium]
MNTYKKYVSLVALATSAFATVLSTSMVRIAAPYIQETLALRYAHLTWIHNSYQISYAILLPVFGQLGDRYGRRRILLAGLALFGLGSIMSGLSWSIGSLIMFRLLQGIGGAAIFPNALTIGTGLFSKRDRGKAMGIWAMGVSMGSVAGPTLGGFIVGLLGWRSVFFVNVLFIVISAVAIFSIVNTKEEMDKETERFDFRGTIMLAFIITMLITSIVSGPDRGWTDPLILFMMTAVLVALPMFWRHEGEHGKPVIDPNLLRNRTFMSGMLCGGVHLVAIQGMNFLMPLFLSQVHELSPLIIGLVMLPQAAVRLVISPLSGYLADRFGNTLPVAVGLLIRTTGLILMGLLTQASSVFYVGFCLVLDGTGAALIWAPSMNAAMESSPEEKRGSVAGVFNMLRFVMGSLGTVLVGVVLDLTFREPTSAAPVAGYLHAYLMIASFTALALFRVKDLRVRSDQDLAT